MNGITRASWFETREDALLTMRVVALASLIYRVGLADGTAAERPTLAGGRGAPGAPLLAGGRGAAPGGAA